MPFGFHPFELIIIFVIALLIFGPKRLPEMGKSIGQSIQMFKKGMNELSAPKEDVSTPAEPVASQRSLDAARLELEALEREMAIKRAAAEQEAAQPEVETHESKSTAHVD